MQPKAAFCCQGFMKKLSILVIGIVLLYSCKKDQLSTYKHHLSGKWEYVRFVGYPFNSAPLLNGNGQIIVISKSGSFERRRNDTITFNGLYYLEEKKDCHGELKKIFIKTTDPSFDYDSIIESTGDSLFISSSNCLLDGGTSVYRKL